MCKRNKACTYMFIVVMVLQIIIPALSVILETSYTLTSEAAVGNFVTWENIGAEGSNVSAMLSPAGCLNILGEGKIKDDIIWKKDNFDYRLSILEVIISKDVYAIGKNAFINCGKLKSVQANYVENIGESAFKRMYKTRINYYE